MGIQLKLVLIAYTVNLVLTSVHPDSQIVGQVVPGNVNDGSSIQKNVQNLFASIAKNNLRTSETYHEFLKQGVAKEQQSFDAMKEELWMTRNRNAYKKGDFYKKIHINENGIITKRETKEENRSSGMNTTGNSELEDTTTGELFKKFHSNWMKTPEDPWLELDNFTMNTMKDICTQVLTKIYKSHSTDDKFTYVDLPGGQLIRRVVDRGAVKFEDGVKYMPLVKCQFKSLDFYLARVDKYYVFRLEKDRSEDTFYFHDGPYRIEYNFDS